MWQFFTLIVPFLRSFLRDESAANAVEYSLTMALVSVFIIAGILVMSGEIGELFNKMEECLGDPAICTPDIFYKFCTQPGQNCGKS
jgi:Flp pilus assembly pilin Flp